MNVGSLGFEQGTGSATEDWKNWEEAMGVVVEGKVRSCGDDLFVCCGNEVECWRQQCVCGCGSNVGCSGTLTETDHLNNVVEVMMTWTGTLCGTGEGNDDWGDCE